jgi:hypothetical protein
VVAAAGQQLQGVVLTQDSPDLSHLGEVMATVVMLYMKLTHLCDRSVSVRFAALLRLWCCLVC